MVIIADDVHRAHNVERDNKQPEEWTDSYCEQRQHGQYTGGKVAVGGESGKVRRQIRSDNAWNKKDQAEEAEAVQRGDDALSTDAVHRPEPGPDIRTRSKQPRDVAENELDLENGAY